MEIQIYFMLPILFLSLIVKNVQKKHGFSLYHKVQQSFEEFYFLITVKNGTLKIILELFYILNHFQVACQSFASVQSGNLGISSNPDS
jgi:hypothetical protein